MQTLVVLAVILVGGAVAIAYNFALVETALGGTSGSGETKTNCPHCGARTTTEPPRCDYCETRLP